VATCAVCSHPIIPSQRFVIAGTEVVHRECARTGRVTLLSRTQSMLQDARVQIAELERSRTERSTAFMRENRRLRDELNQVMRERDAARAERDSARAEVALRAAMESPAPPLPAPPPPPPRPPSTDVPVEEEVQEDPSVIRMSLLELV